MEKRMDQCAVPTQNWFFTIFTRAQWAKNEKTCELSSGGRTISSKGGGQKIRKMMNFAFLYMKKYALLFLILFQSSELF